MKKIDWQELFRFSVSGVCVIAVDFGGYFFLNQFFATSVSKGVSFGLGTIAAFLINKFWTFQNDKPMSGAEIVKFLVMTGLALLINVGVNEILKSSGEWLALIIATFLTGLFSYFAQKYWVFKK